MSQNTATRPGLPLLHLQPHSSYFPSNILVSELPRTRMWVGTGLAAINRKHRRPIGDRHSATRVRYPSYKVHGPHLVRSKRTSAFRKLPYKPTSKWANVRRHGWKVDLLELSIDVGMHWILHSRWRKDRHGPCSRSRCRWEWAFYWTIGCTLESTKGDAPSLICEHVEWNPHRSDGFSW